jgi:hypothetical protein
LHLFFTLKRIFKKSFEYQYMLSAQSVSIFGHLRTIWLILSTFLIQNLCIAQNIQFYDVVIYGGTSAGVSAAIQASRMGKKVILIEPFKRIGGLTTGGLGKTDIGNKQAIGGLSREFYQNIKKYYLKPENWIYQQRESYRGVGYNTFEEDAMWAFEPSAALKVYHEMLEKEPNIRIVYQQRLNRKTGVKKEGQVIKSIQMETGQIYQGKMFMDCTYEGDLMAASGVSYTVGREANSQYGESLNGVQANNVSLTLHKKISRNSMHHNFIEGVSPYLVKDNPKSGLLPFVNPGKPGIDGQADHKIQAYCYRMTLTDHPDNRIPFKKPIGYKEIEYELLFRNYEAAKGEISKMYDYGDPLVPWINSEMPNRKTDTNNQKGFSTDFVGQNYLYPEASYEDRLKIASLHKKYQKGLMWTLAYHPRIPKQVRDVVSKWGMCQDEFSQDEGWTDQLYIREARRLVSDYVMTQRDCEALAVAQDVIGLGAYQMDSHPIQRYVDLNGYVKNEGNVEAHVDAPFPISYKSIIPKKSEVTNLFIPVCLSSSHIAYGSIRMEPVFMVLGQSAAIAASIAIDKNCQTHEVPYQELREALIKNHQILK